MAATEKNATLRKRAAAAAFTLLGVPPAAQAAAPASSSPAPTTPVPWSMDASFLYYSEAERMTVLEPQIAVRRDYPDDRSLTIMATVDTISGATPLGTLPATPQTAPNTITSPSGNTTNGIVGKIPLSNMTDTRLALDTSWKQPLGNNYTEQFGANASKETDFIALGANSSLARDFNEKNTTLSVGIAPEFDISDPNGGIPVPFATFGTPGSVDQTRDTRWLASGLFGLTQVINPKLLMQLNYGYTYEHGYLNDPYKLLSVTDAQGNPLIAVYENRPEHRSEHSFYWLTRYNIWARDVFGLGFRYYTDDWGIRSQTLDFTYRRQTSDRFYWEPHVRYYHQSAADFFRAGLVTGQPFPDFASADLRLDDFDGVTIGVRTGFTLRDGSELILRADYYTQTGDSHPSSAVGAQKSYDLFPTLYATIFQVEYHFLPSQLFSKKGR